MQILQVPTEFCRQVARVSLSNWDKHPLSIWPAGKTMLKQELFNGSRQVREKIDGTGVSIHAGEPNDPHTKHESEIFKKN